MEGNNKTEHFSNEEILHKSKVHRILAHSYSTYFILFLVGVTLDLIFKFKIFSSSVMVPVGLFFLIVASIVIFWAQKAGRNDIKEDGELKMEHFCRGPYCYTRSPTHWGLFFLMLGFGIMVNAVFVVLFTFISFLITRFVFLEKREKIFEEKYGDPYLKYKKSVKF